MYLAIGVAGGIVLLLLIVFLIYRVKQRQKLLKVTSNHKNVSMGDIKGSRANENVYDDDY